MSETLYVLIKRDLFECPKHLGYTGIKELAGAWPLSLVESQTVPVKDKYEPKYKDSYALPFDLAPAFTRACFHDLAIAHLQKKVAAFEEAVTPSGNTKYAYHGEFKFNQIGVDEDGEERSYPVYVPWTTVKEIMAAISVRAKTSIGAA
ncbi:hypothetical protein [Rhizobium sp. 2MFCol3.1]|uniref:hypothetical protein n=1 Tax=Rhizobium sp. 2MFCol3.1 TaxID=1246459 RepID=UPI0003793F02|nr:hypothetical protein [Rhizobium sp. 2MFCol3.1]